MDAKTVERWITRGRLPYRRHRFEVATFLGVDEAYIWPDALGKDEIAAVSESEIVAVWPHRSEVPRDVWGHLFSQAERGVLAPSALRCPLPPGSHCPRPSGQSQVRAGGRNRAHLAR